MKINRKWEVLHKQGTKSSTGSKSIKSTERMIVDILLKNRGLKEEKERKDFFKPTHPEKISVGSLGLSKSEIEKAIKRIKKARNEKEKVIVYGDYDADGICATAVLWEVLYKLKVDCLPYIPERFSEGYGLNPESIRKLKKEYSNLGLIITVDNGIVANDAVDLANSLGIDVVIADHHQKDEKVPKAHSIVHTDKVGGAAIAWILGREILKKFEIRNSKFEITNSLELVAIGTIADQIPLLGPNRSFVKHGLIELNKTKRIGLEELIKTAGIKPDSIGQYEVGFLIAPRLNAMGRIKHAIDSLRLICTNDHKKAKDLANYLNRTNLERQKIVEDVVAHAKNSAGKKKWKGVIVLAHKNYHEGVVGLAASKLVEEFYRPAIVISKGKTISKASARSIPGFNIIKVIRKLDKLILGGGGHPMAAGFSIETKKIIRFIKRIEERSDPLLPDELLQKKLRIDLEIGFDQITEKLVSEIEKFAPVGIGNPIPTFLTRKVEVVDARTVGKESNHLKLRLGLKTVVFDAIYFGGGEIYPNLTIGKQIDIVYGIEEDKWNGDGKIQLKIKDLVVCR